MTGERSDEPSPLLHASISSSSSHSLPKGGGAPRMPPMFLGAKAAALSLRVSAFSAGSTDPSELSVVRSASQRPLSAQQTSLASRSSLQHRIPVLWHSAVTTS